MAETIDLLAEISDDPTDQDSDYGRGWLASLVEIRRAFLDANGDMPAWQGWDIASILVIVNEAIEEAEDV